MDFKLPQLYALFKQTLEKAIPAPTYSPQLFRPQHALPTAQIRRECMHNSYNGSNENSAKQLTIVLEPLFPDQAPIAYDAHTGQLKLLFAELHQFTQIFPSIMNKWLSTRKVNLFHTCERKVVCTWLPLIIVMDTVIISQHNRKETKTFHYPLTLEFPHQLYFID